MTVKMGTKKGIALAQLGLMLKYPQGDFQKDMSRLGQSVVSSFPKTKKQIELLEAALNKNSQTEFEELFTRTFDLAAICSPYVTGYIFGDENFDRGTLMATLQEKYSELGFDSQGELPDHLSLLLRFSSWLDDEELEELVSFCMLEPVKEMTDRLKDSDNAYYFILSAVLLILNTESKEVENG